MSLATMTCDACGASIATAGRTAQRDDCLLCTHLPGQHSLVAGCLASRCECRAHVQQMRCPACPDFPSTPGQLAFGL